MTDTPKTDDQQPESAQQSLSLLADHKDLLRLRLLPVELAKVLNVTKQTISVWIKDGKITPPSPIDGRLDAQAAVRQVLRNTPPGKIRARILRQATEDAQALREAAASADARVAAVEAERDAKLAEAQRSIEHLQSYAEDGDCMFDRLLALLIESELSLRATADSDEWRALVGRIEMAAADACAADDLDELDADAIAALEALAARDMATPEGGGGD